MRSRVLLTSAVCVLALALRVYTLYRTPASVWSGAETERVAVALSEGKGWADAFGKGTGPTAHVAPLYPLLLSGIYRLCGTYRTAPGRLVQGSLATVLATLAVLLLPVTARRLRLPAAAGWAGALLAACLPANLETEVTGSFEQGLATLALLGLVGSLAGLQRNAWSGRRRLLETGILLGMTALLSPNFLLVPVTFWLIEWTWRAGERRQILRGGVVLAAIGLVCVAPWLARNYLVLGGLVPLRSNFGLELAVGNRPGANGHTFAPGFGAVHPSTSPVERLRLQQLGELAYMKEKQCQALTWIRANPRSFAWLTLRRSWLFWFTPDERCYLLDLKWRLSSRLYGLLGLVVLLELLRLLRSDQSTGRLLACALFSVALPYCLTHVEMRYRLPIVGLFALLSCNLVVTVVDGMRTRLRPPAPPATILYRRPPAKRAA